MSPPRSHEIDHPVGDRKQRQAVQLEYIAPSSRSALDGESLQLSAPHGVSSAGESCSSCTGVYNIEAEKGHDRGAAESFRLVFVC